MNISNETKKTEAIKRMKAFGINPAIINAFANNDTVYVSASPFGLLRVSDDLQAEIAKFEQEYNALVYHVIHSDSNIGILDNFLFVSDYKEDWVYDHDDAINNQQCVYVLNHTYPDCSEIGAIGIECINGCLTRTW